MIAHRTTESLRFRESGSLAQSCRFVNVPAPSTTELIFRIERSIQRSLGILNVVRVLANLLFHKFSSVSRFALLIKYWFIQLSRHNSKDDCFLEKRLQMSCTVSPGFFSSH